ncbi:MAG: nuclear transport factor 2 family protein [bacterium]
MSQENVEIVRQLYIAMNARDVEAFAELADPDLEWIPDSRVVQAPVRGRGSIIRFFLEQAEVFEEFRLEPERFWDTDDKVLVFVRTTGSGAASGAGFDIRIGHLWTLRDGLVVRGEGHANRDEALEAAGLRE